MPDLDPQAAEGRIWAQVLALLPGARGWARARLAQGLEESVDTGRIQASKVGRGQGLERVGEPD
jgi:hypothetical protein